MEWLMVMIETEEIREVKTNAQVGTKDKEEGWCVEGEEVVAAGVGGFCCLCCLCSRTSLRLSFFLIAHHDDMPSSFSCFCCCVGSCFFGVDVVCRCKCNSSVFALINSP